MRAFTLFLAVSGLAAVLPAPAALAQEICLFGGPDAAADLACGPAYVEPVRRAPSSGPSPAGSRALAPLSAPGPSVVAQSRITSGPAGQAGVTGAAQSRILSGGRVGPAGPGTQAGWAPPPQEFAPPPEAYLYAPDGAPPPPPEFGTYIAAEGAGPQPGAYAPGAYAYAYESADGGAFAWRYDTPQGPAWAYAFETPEGWAYAYAYDTAPDGPPPAVIEARGIDARGMEGHHGGAYRGAPYRGPYVEHAEEHYVAGADWRYSEERLFGAAYRQSLYLVETYYRESEWVAVSAIPGRRYLCGGCVAGGPVHGAPYAGPYPGPQARGGFIVSGGGGAVSAFGATGSYLVGGGAAGGSVSRASQSFSVRDSASQTMQAQATATGNQTVTGGTPFTPPPGAVPPWGPPAQISAGNTANAYAGAGAASAAAGNVSARAGR